MYKCVLCDKSSESGQTQHRLVTETRPKQYFIEGRLVGTGNEIVTEIAVCEGCKIDKTLVPN